MTIKTATLRSIIIAAMITTTPAIADTVYVTDQGHTEVLFGWSHAGVSRQNGEFEKAVGTLTLAEKFEDSSINVVIDAASVSTGFDALDKHLKSKDFLEVETYPELTFQSTDVKQIDETKLEVSGNLTIHGVTKPVTLQASMTHRGEHPLGKAIDYYQGEWIAFQATTEIDHQSFGVGGFSTGPISIEINTELKAK